MRKIGRWMTFLFFLLIVEFITGNPACRLLQATSIRLDLQNWANKVTGIEIPKNVKILTIKSFMSLTGAGGDTVYLQLTPKQAQSLLKQINGQPEWRLITEERTLTLCQLPSEYPIYQTEVLVKENQYYERRIRSQEGENKATFCPAVNRLKIQTTHD
jgi:hypothetical protein